MFFVGTVLTWWSNFVGAFTRQPGRNPKDLVRRPVSLEELRAQTKAAFPSEEGEDLPSLR